MELWRTKLLRVWALCFLHVGWEIGLTLVVSITTTLQHIQLCHLSPSCLQFYEYRGLGRRDVMVRRTCAKLGMKISHWNMNIKRKVNFLVSRCLYQVYYWCWKWTARLCCARDVYGNLKGEFISEKREFQFLREWLKLLWDYLVLSLKQYWSGRHFLSREVEETFISISLFYKRVPWAR